MENAIQNTEQLIRAAAHKVFKQKGFAGASVQDIADAAGITKSMVNYYFRSKQKLFEHIFQAELRTLFSNIATFIGADMPLRQKIEKIVAFDIDMMASFPDLPIFVMNEANRNPEIVFKNIDPFRPSELIHALDRHIQTEVRKGIIRKVRAADLIINIQSLTIFPILARPMITRIMGLDEKAYCKLLQSRKKDIVDIIWQSIKV